MADVMGHELGVLGQQDDRDAHGMGQDDFIEDIGIAVRTVRDDQPGGADRIPDVGDDEVIGCPVITARKVLERNTRISRDSGAAGVASGILFMQPVHRPALAFGRPQP